MNDTLQTVFLVMGIVAVSMIAIRLLRPVLETIFLVLAIIILWMMVAIKKIWKAIW